MKAGTKGIWAKCAIMALAALWLALNAHLACAAEWETYLNDAFDGPDSMFYTGQAGEAYYSLDNGRYLIDGMNTGVDSLSALTDNLYYYYVEAQCELLDSTAGELAFSGVVFHYNKKVQGKLSYYVFYAYGDGYYGAKRVIGDQVEIVLPLARSELLDTGRPNILGVDCQGTRFDLYINGRYVDGFTDVRVDGGGCGFYVSKFSKAAFDSFIVKVEHRGGSVIPPEAPLTVDSSGMPHGGNGAEAEPPGIAPDNSLPAGTQEGGHSFLGYSAPAIPKDPDRPVYPWEVGVDKTGKGKKHASSGGDDGGAASGGASSGAPPPSEHEASAAAPPKAPPGSADAAPAQHPASQATEQPATKLGAAPAAAAPRGDLPHQSIRDAGKPGQPPVSSPAPGAVESAGQAEPAAAGAPVLPAGEELMPDQQGAGRSVPPAPPKTAPAPPTPAATQPELSGDTSADVQLVPAGEADELAEHSADAQAESSHTTQPEAAADAASALGNAKPAQAAGSVLKRIRPNAGAPQYQPTPVQPRPVADSPALDSAPAVEPAASLEEPPDADAALTSGDGDLALFANNTPTSSEPAAATSAAAPPSSEPAAAAAPPASTDTVNLGKIEPQYGKLTQDGQPANEPAPALGIPDQPVGTGPAASDASTPAEGAAPAGTTPAEELSLFGNDSASAATPSTEPGPAEASAPAATPAAATPAASPKASAYFSGPGAQVITDDFAQQTWPVSENGPSTYRYFGAAYEVDNLKAETMAISFQEGKFADCELSITAEFLDGASYVGYGAAARFSVGNKGVSYYGLFISRSGEFLLLKVVDGAETVLKDWTASTLINPSQANTITLEIVGKRLTAYVNGTAAASVQDTDLVSGGYALLAGPGVKVRYDDLRLRGYLAK